MNGFLKELCAWLDADRFGPKVLFCAGRPQGQQLLRMAARHGTPAVNVEPQTVWEYAGQLAGLGQRLDSVTASIALRRIMEGAGDAFTTLGVVELSTAGSVLGQLMELEMNGVSPEALAGAGEDVLARVWQAFMDWRRQKGYPSMEQLLEAAVPPQGTACAIVSDVPLTLMEQRFLAKIPKERLTVLHRVAPKGAQIPRGAVLQAAGEADVGKPECVVCQDVQSEIRAAFQYLAERSIPAEDAVVACPDADYGLRVEEQGRLLGVPVASAFGTPADMTRGALFLRCLLDWAGRDYDAEALRPALLSGAMELRGDMRMRGQELLRIFRTEAVGWGAARWERLAESEKSRAAAAGRLMADWAALFAEGPRPVRAIAQKALGIMDRSMPQGAETGYYVNLIDEISRVYEGDMTAAEFLEIVQAAADTGAVEAHPSPAPGAVYCCAYADAAYVDRPVFIILGMSWDALDRQEREFPLLRDEVKRALSGGLRLSGDGARQRQYAILALLANREDARVLFSRAAMDRVGGEDLLASSLFEDALGGEEPRRESILQRRPLTGLDVHLRAGIAAPKPPEEPTRQRAELWGEAIEKRVWSASRLETACACPRKFTLEVMMGVKEEDPAALERFRQSWLAPRDRGDLLHEVLEAYFRAKMPRSEAVDEVLLRKLVAQAGEKLQATIPMPANLAGAEEELDAALAIAGQEARLHSREPGRHTVGAEVAFGYEEPFYYTFGAHTIRMKGRIDRVDEVDGAYEIVDYKTGKPGRFRQQFSTKLQYYLYALAWEKLHPGARVKRASYHMLDGVGGVEQLTVELTEEVRGALYQKVSELLDLLSDAGRALTSREELYGGATDTPYGSCPNYCPLRDVCREVFK